MLKRLLHSISAERTSVNQEAFLPTFYQHQKVYDFCKKYIRDKSVIEVGCGTGFGAYTLSDFAKNYTGLDKDEFSIEENKQKFQKKNLTFIAKDLNTFSASKKYDVVISLQVIEHFKDVDKYLNKIRSLLKNDGLFILSTPNSRTQSYNENPYHFKEYTEKELQKLLNKYFRSVKLFGLHGDTIVKKYEQQRRKKVLSILHYDVLNVRKLLPRRVKQYLFDLVATLNRSLLMKSDVVSNKINKNNYHITLNAKNAIDLLTIVKK